MPMFEKLCCVNLYVRHPYKKIKNKKIKTMTADKPILCFKYFH